MDSMNGWRAPAVVVLTSIAIGSLLMAAHIFADERTPKKVVPDVRGRAPAVGLAEDRTGTGLLLEAGFCVDFHYDSSSSQVEGTGTWISDGFFIGDQIPEPGSKLAAGSTVTVVVRGSEMVGDWTGWDALPRVCPGLLSRIPAAA